MTGFEERFNPGRTRSGNPAVCLLREQFERLATSQRSASDCEWIADCLYQLEQYGDAADWYEMAGDLILAGSAPAQLRALSALGTFEKALECHALDRDEESFREISEMTRALRRTCASA